MKHTIFKKLLLLLLFSSWIVSLCLFFLSLFFEKINISHSPLTKQLVLSSLVSQIVTKKMKCVSLALFSIQFFVIMCHFLLVCTLQKVIAARQWASSFAFHSQMKKIKKIKSYWVICLQLVCVNAADSNTKTMIRWHNVDFHMLICVYVSIEPIRSANWNFLTHNFSGACYIGHFIWTTFC